MVKKNIETKIRKKFLIFIMCVFGLTALVFLLAFPGDKTQIEENNVNISSYFPKLSELGSGYISEHILNENNERSITADREHYTYEELGFIAGESRIYNYSQNIEFNLQINISRYSESGVKIKFDIINQKYENLLNSNPNYFEKIRHSIGEKSMIYTFYNQTSQEFFIKLFYYKGRTLVDLMIFSDEILSIGKAQSVAIVILNKLE
ncbi:MAG: hypothetical protein PHW96_04170 [Candidatus Nanoarchaeia archaeon]|nr:hypothetical protein [Candidatus Nanoarchaeia archaeon]